MTTQNHTISQGYKDSPLGVIPQEWEVKRLEEVSVIKGGYAFDSSRFKDCGKYQVVKMSNLYEGLLDLERSKSFIDEINAAEFEYILKPNDILITLTGTIGKRDYGYTFQISRKKNLLLNQRVAKIQAKNIDDSFLYFYTKTLPFLNGFFLCSRGGTGNQSNVSTIDVGKLRIVYPPLPEQQKIAEILSVWDRAIEVQMQLITSLQTRKHALMQQLLTGKKRLKGFSGEWCKYPYEKLLKTIKRPIVWDDNELYNLISVRRRSGGIFFRDELYGHQIKVKDLRSVEEGDFLFSKMQIVHGASALVTKDYVGAKVSGSYISVVVKDGKLLNIDFLNYFSQQKYF
jgi:type I restriction enzyme S subunit